MSPVVVTQLVLLAVAAGGWVTGKLVHRAFVRRTADGEHYAAMLPRMSDTIAFISGAVGILLGLLLSFSVSNFQDTQASVKQFGTSVANAYRTTESFAEPGRTVVRQDLYCAVDSFVSNDWTDGVQPSLTGGAQTSLWMSRLNADINQLDPETNTQVQAFPLLVQGTLDMNQWRQMILLTSMETIPGVIWVVIFVSVFLLTVLLALHLADRRGLGRLSFGVACIALAVIIFALSVLDYPLQNFGTGPAVSPQSLIEMLQAENFDLVGELSHDCPVITAADVLD